MEFKKTSEKVIRPQEPSYFMIREFSFDKIATNVLAEFMKSSFFCWKEEYRNEITVNIDSEEKIVNWNFHGLYDITKLRTDHFHKVSAADFVERFKESVVMEIESDPSLPTIVKELVDQTDLKSDFYIIKNLPLDFHHEWTVFNFFISGFKINEKNGKLTAIEFGLD